MDLLRFLSELNRRRVVRVAIVYVVAAFAVLQAADIIFPALGLPAWTVTLVVVLSFLGFPVALALAWAFDLTPAGVVRTGNVPWEVEERRRERPHGLPRKALPYLGIGILVGLVSVGAYSGIRPGAGETGDSSVAVLPFASLTAGEENAYLASGIHNEILTHLSKVGGLKVIARSSVLQYAGGERTLAEIERLLREPSPLSPARLRLDPAWAPLRGDPRFERILASTSY